MLISGVFQDLTEYDELRPKQVSELFTRMQRFETHPRLCYRLHRDIRNIECLITLDASSDLAAGINTSMAPEERARRFLIDNVALFSFTLGDTTGLEQQRQRFDRRLFLKHQMRSALGSHCIFGWRDRKSVV